MARGWIFAVGAAVLAVARVAAAAAAAAVIDADVTAALEANGARVCAR